MDKKKTAAMLALWSTSLANTAVAHPVASPIGHGASTATTAHGHATLRAVVCNSLNNYPSDGASARIISNGRHQIVLTLSKPENTCSDKGQDGTYVGGRIDCPGFPANSFTCTISNFVHGQPIFSIVVRNPGGTSSTYVGVPYTSTTSRRGEIRITSDLSSLGLARGTQFLAVYAWVDVVGDVDISQFAIDGVAAVPSLRVPLGFDCTGIFPSDCGSSGSPSC